ncbi:hypothetical protein B4966_08570 [Rhodocyclaceae bacterium]|jgi:TetR/AcrR family transcriptional repressor of nem operon|nr:hypothetical protein B4966_08570 [Rhodocyclaceae bacterium]
MCPGRPLQFDPVTALEQAAEVFWAKGYEATSLQDLLAATGLSKSSFYQAFESKHRLFARVLVWFRERQVARLRRALATASSPRAFIAGALRATAEEAGAGRTPKGCLIMNTASEFAGRDSEVATRVDDAIRAFAAVFEDAVRQAQACGEIAPHQDPAALSRYVVTLMSGLRTMAKAGMPAEAIEEVVEVSLRALR